METLTFRDRSERFCLNNSSANVYSRTVVAWYDYVDVTSITCSKEYITRYIRLPLFSYSPLCWILLRVSLVVSQFETLRRIGIFVKRFGIWKKRIWIVFCINFVKLERDCDCYLTLDDTLIMISNTINRRSEEEEESKKVSVDDKISFSPIFLIFLIINSLLTNVPFNAQLMIYLILGCVINYTVITVSWSVRLKLIEINYSSRLRKMYNEIPKWHR